MALNSQNKQYILKTFFDLGIELEIPEDVDKEKLMDMVPIYANGLLDTAPLPSDIEINPFSLESPVQQMPIRKFNADLFMVLRTLGLLRALSETLEVNRQDCWMSTLFRPFAARGMRLEGMSETQRRRLSVATQSKLTSGASSPFDSCDAYNDTPNCVFS